MNRNQVIVGTPQTVKMKRQVDAQFLAWMVDQKQPVSVVVEKTMWHQSKIRKLEKEVKKILDNIEIHRKIVNTAKHYMESVGGKEYTEVMSALVDRKKKQRQEIDEELKYMQTQLGSSFSSPPKRS